jgi:hypothetical protein
VNVQVWSEKSETIEHHSKRGKRPRKPKTTGVKAYFLRPSSRTQEAPKPLSSPKWTSGLKGLLIWFVTENEKDHIHKNRDIRPRTVKTRHNKDIT